MKDISLLKQKIDDFLIGRFGFAPTKTDFQFHNTDEWNEFCSKNRLETTANGVYMVRDSSAHVLQDVELALQAFFHEYYGHGYYTEYSLPGKRLKALESRLKEEEQDASIDTIGKLEEFRQHSTTCRVLQGFKQKIMPEYEGFAMWMEWYLSELFCAEGEFAEKYEKFSTEEKGICSRFVQYSQDYGEHALFFSSGMPKHYNSGIIQNILERLYGDDFESIKMAMVYGSRKPYSDIDLFIVSDKVNCANFGWLDIYAVNTGIFEDLIAKFDISITDPLFTGDFVCGSNEYLKQTRANIIAAPITQQAIEFHNRHAEEAKKLALKYPADSAEFQTAMRYNASYIANAREMAQGRKPLILANLIERYQDDFKGFKQHYGKSIATGGI